MRKLLTILGFIGLISTGFAENKADLPKDVTLAATTTTTIKHLPIITNEIDENVSVKFEIGNFFPVISGFSEKLLADFSEHLMGYEEEEMLIYFDSPGGSVFAMARMIGLMNSSNIKFTCVARFAASAAFNMFEACDTRLMLPDAIIMSHEWSGGFRDEAPRILSLYNAVNSLVADIEKQTVSKLNIDMRTYKELINKNLWMPVGLAKKYGALDGIVSDVSCSKKLTEQRVTKTTQSWGLFGPINRTHIKNGCPLISKSYKKKDRNEYYSYGDSSLFIYTKEAQLRDRLGTHQITFELNRKLNEPRIGK